MVLVDSYLGPKQALDSSAAAAAVGMAASAAAVAAAVVAVPEEEEVETEEEEEEEAEGVERAQDKYLWNLRKACKMIGGYCWGCVQV